jgi:hypothetical protein
VWPFTRNPTANKSSRKTQDLSPKTLEDSARRQDLFALLELFLVTRVQNELSLEEKRAEVTLKKAEAEAQTALKVAELREQRRQLRASQASFRNRTHPRDAKGQLLPMRYQQSGCRVCENPSSADLTVDEIRGHHAAGHTDGRQRPN